MVKYDTESWIAQAEKLYPGEFSYNKTCYVDSYHKVQVKCNKHKKYFITDPISFLKNKKGCKQCSPKNKPQIKEVKLPEFETDNDGYCQLKYSDVKLLRDYLLKKQNGQCLLCKELILPPKFATLDHYHSKRQHGSGLVRGVLCNTCNRMVGVIENNLARNCVNYSDAPDFLIRVADYLLNQREDFLYPSERKKDPVLMKSSYNKLVKAISGKQKVPEYTGKLTKKLKKLFNKYNIEPSFKKSSTR